MFIGNKGSIATSLDHESPCASASRDTSMSHASCSTSSSSLNARSSSESTRSTVHTATLTSNCEDKEFQERNKVDPSYVFTSVHFSTDACSSRNLDLPTKSVCCILSGNTTTMSERAGEGENKNTKGKRTKSKSNVKGFGVLKAIRSVYNTRKINGEEYSIIGRWAFLANLLLNAAVYWPVFALCLVFANSIDVSTSEKAVGIYASLACLIIVCCLMVCTTGYCLYNYEHPLVRSRGMEYIVAVLVSAVIVVLCSYVLMLHYIGVADLKSDAVAFVLECIHTVSITVMVGVQAARQHLIYCLFVRYPFERYKRSRSSYRSAYALLLVWSLVGLIPLVVLFVVYSSFTLSMMLLRALPAAVMLLVLFYYTWLSRNVSQAFSDWRSTVRVGIVLSLGTVLMGIIHSTVFRSSSPYNIAREDTATAGSVYLSLYMSLFLVAVVSTEMFGMIAAIVYFRLQTDGDLDPKSLFVNAWHVSSSSHGNGENAHLDRVQMGPRIPSA
eukprot:CFRG7215T1